MTHLGTGIGTGIEGFWHPASTIKLKQVQLKAVNWSDCTQTQLIIDMSGVDVGEGDTELKW